MSDYSDGYKDQETRRLLERWTPDGVGRLEVTEAQLRYTLARMRKAEYQLQEIKNALHTLKDTLR